MKTKKKIGIFSLTACAGCQLKLLNLDEIFFEIVDSFDITHFKLLKEVNEKGPFDIVLVEGCATQKKEVALLKKIRKSTHYLIALGTCATYGGIPSIKDFYDEAKIEKIVYGSVKNVSSLRVEGISKYVEVDYFMRGCPVHKEEFMRVIKSLLTEKKPINITSSVCVECREKENICLLQQGKLCLGPVTFGGCSALCPSVSVECVGCNGPCDDANVSAEAELFKKHGISRLDIERHFRTFAGTSKIFREYCELCQLKDKNKK